MIVNKLLFTLLTLKFFIVFSQEKQTYPKDTIYLKYEFKTGNTWNNKFERKFQNEKGIYFNIVTKNGDLALFASYKSNFDTLNVDEIKNINFFDFNEIRKKEIEWVNKKYRDLKIKPYSGSKNAVFVTFVIEQINKDCIVKYPVIWRNEGVTD